MLSQKPGFHVAFSLYLCSVSVALHISSYLQDSVWRAIEIHYLFPLERLV